MKLFQAPMVPEVKVSFIFRTDNGGQQLEHLKAWVDMKLLFNHQWNKQAFAGSLMIIKSP